MKLQFMISLAKFSKRFYCFGVCLLFFVCTASAQYNALFWKISGNGLHKPSYIYGTMHVSDDRVFQFSKGVMPAFARSKAFAMELDPDQIFSPSLVASMMMDTAHSIRKSLPDSDYVFLDSIMTKATGVSFSLLDRLSPVLISAMLEQSEVNASATNSAKQQHDFLDMYFWGLAKKGKKKVIGIESVAEQISALQSLSYPEQITMLQEELHKMKETVFGEQNILELYVKGELDSLQTKGNDTNMPALFYKAIVTDRNERMAERIDKFIRNNPSFIAVGALHLASPKGIIGLLIKKGYKLEPVK